MMHRMSLVLLIALLPTPFAVGQDAGAIRRAAFYEPLMIDAGSRYGVDPRLLWTIAYLETRFRPELVSPAGARGMMQFMPFTANRYGLRDPHNAQGSIVAAARYLRELQSIFNHRLDLILAAYNAGEGAVMAFRDGRKLLLSNGKVINPKGIKTGGVPPYRETYGYVREGIELFSRLANGSKWIGEKYKGLSLPETLDPEEPTESAPKEILELKRGSIYIASGPNLITERPQLSHQSTSRSIYSR